MKKTFNIPQNLDLREDVSYRLDAEKGIIYVEPLQTENFIALDKLLALSIFATDVIFENAMENKKKYRKCTLEELENMGVSFGSAWEHNRMMEMESDSSIFCAMAVHTYRDIVCKSYEENLVDFCYASLCRMVRSLGGIYYVMVPDKLNSPYIQRYFVDEGESAEEVRYFRNYVKTTCPQWYPDTDAIETILIHEITDDMIQAMVQSD